MLAVRAWLTRVSNFKLKKMSETLTTTRPTWNDEMVKELAQIVGKQVNEWCNNETPLEDCIETAEKFFFDLSEVVDYCNEYEINPRDLKLVVCYKSSFTPLSLDWITSDGESVHEDWEPSKEFEEKINEFNQWLSTQDTHTWFPSNGRIDITKHLK